MTFKTTLTATAVAALLAGGAVADSHKTDDKADMTQMPKVTADAAAAGPEWIKNMTVGDIIGMSVRTEGGDDVGEIDYVIMQDGALAGVIGVGGFLGLGEYTVAMPLTDFEMGDGEGELIRDLVISKTAEELKAMPEISEMGLESIDDDVLLSEAIAKPGSFAEANTDGAPATIGTTNVQETAKANTLTTPDADMDTEETADAGAMDDTAEIEGDEVADVDVMENPGMATEDMDVAETTETDAMETEGDVTADAGTMETEGDAMETEGDVTAEADAEATSPVTEDEIATSVTNVDMTPLNERTVDDVIGLTVVDQRNRVVGEIDYIIPKENSVAAVIGMGGFLGLGEYTVAIPLDEFELTAENRLELGMTEDELEALPEIDESEIESLDGEMRIGDVI